MKQIPDDWRCDKDYFKRLEAQAKLQELEDHEVVSSCCSAKVDQQQLCSACKDHCGFFCIECDKEFWNRDEH